MNEILAAMIEIGIELIPDGMTLRMRLPKGIPQEIVDEIRRHREDLIQAYNSRAAVREFDAGYPREEAERLAVEDLMEIGERLTERVEP